MFALKDVIKLLGLEDSDVVYLCHEHCESLVTPISVKEIRKKHDMKNTMVERVYPYHFRYSNDMDWELIVK